MATPTPEERLSISPSPQVWRTGIEAAWHHSRADAAAMAFRGQLGLPTNGPIVMSGHQAQFWHAGILAKHFAALAAASAISGNAHAAWITVDQDSHDPWPLPAPTPGLERIVMRLGPAAEADRPVCTMPASSGPHSLIAPHLPALVPSAAAGASRIADALARHTGAASAAAQIASALRDLIAPLTPDRAPPIGLFATRISGTDLFSNAVASMREDPALCAVHYNAAARTHPAAGIRPLSLTADQVELPLWHIVPTGPRRRVHAHQLADIPVTQLAPRALLMTALLRSAACDLFIHGVGGGVYDQVTDAWIGAWKPKWRLAPTAVVTATRYLSIENAPDVPSPQAIARAQWRHHRALHDPSLLDDDAAAAEKRDMLRQIRETRAAGGHPLPLYRRMHALLARVRGAHVEKLSELKALADSLNSHRDAAAVLFDRTWAFPMLADQTLQGLRDAIRQAFGQP
ncbi:MAG: hypothetical protein JSR77_08155 [Planctomycetes bacterium]|nr:hypothetical protein [Planctomycetota bacterium]